jgi:8-oxo-dGTP pyrophosphatase MutT (NUDIX family)
LAERTFLIRGLQTYWRWARPVTLGAQGCVLDRDGRVLLVRHTYRPGWHFPGGGVEKRESVLQALARELREEAGIVFDTQPLLHGLFSHHPAFPGDHIALFVIRDWRQPERPAPNREIAEQGFFAVADLPSGINPPTARRISEILEARQPAELW